MATELLADEGTVVLSKKQVARSLEVLNHPPAKSVAAVRKLLTERSILDGWTGIPCLRIGLLGQG
jgi:hypothetical protein